MIRRDINYRQLYELSIATIYIVYNHKQPYKPHIYSLYHHCNQSVPTSLLLAKNIFRMLLHVNNRQCFLNL